MSFRDPLVLLLFLPVAFAFYILKKAKPSSSLLFSSKKLIGNEKRTLKFFLSENIVYLRALAALLFFLALARPQSVSEETKIHREGIDIVLTLDASTSMLAEDFTLGRIRQNRLEVVKKVVEDFIKKRKGDRLGMVAFAARAYTVCPLTLDHEWVIKNLERVEIGSIEDGTAIGSGIASSLNRLKETPAKSKVIILLTDGINNAGKLTPLTAAEAGKALGIKIYTIGAGSKGPVPYPVRTPWGETRYEMVKVEIDEDMLRKVANETGGKYFRATDTQSLEAIYKEIDKLEKTTVEETGYLRYSELFGWFLVSGAIILLLEIMLSKTILRKIP